MIIDFIFDFSILVVVFGVIGVTFAAPALILCAADALYGRMVQSTGRKGG